LGKLKVKVKDKLKLNYILI